MSVVHFWGRWGPLLGQPKITKLELSRLVNQELLEPQERQGSTEANPVCSLVALQQGLVQSWILPKITKLELSKLVNQELLEPE